MRPQDAANKLVIFVPFILLQAQTPPSQGAKWSVEGESKFFDGPRGCPLRDR